MRRKYNNESTLCYRKTTDGQCFMTGLSYKSILYLIFYKDLKNPFFYLRLHIKILCTFVSCRVTTNRVDR